MSAQNLTPQLRTRLSHLEKAVGWFVTLAVLLMLAGLVYYVRTVAENKGWFQPKAPYFCYLKSGAGVKVGDKIKLMGFDAGEITLIVPEDPGKEYNVYVEFVIIGRNIGYIWDDSVVQVRSSGLFGRYLEVTKGGTLRTNNLSPTYRQDPTTHKITDQYVGYENGKENYTPWHKGGKPFWLIAEEPPELSSEIDSTVAMLKISLTNILQLTNALARTLNNAADATDEASRLLKEARPVIRNITAITENLKEPHGALGEWLFPVDMNHQITALLTNANGTVSNVNLTVLAATAAVTNVNTNLIVLFRDIDQSLENLAGITGNLRAQVDRDGNIVSSVSKFIIDTDDMVQGLKRHWLLRSAFKNQDKPKNEEPPPKPSKGAGK